MEFNKENNGINSSNKEMSQIMASFKNVRFLTATLSNMRLGSKRIDYKVFAIYYQFCGTWNQKFFLEQEMDNFTHVTEQYEYYGIPCYRKELPRNLEAEVSQWLKNRVIDDAERQCKEEKRRAATRAENDMESFLDWFDLRPSDKKDLSLVSTLEDPGKPDQDQDVHSNEDSHTTATESGECLDLKTSDAAAERSHVSCGVGCGECNVNNQRTKEFAVPKGVCILKGGSALKSLDDLEPSEEGDSESGDIYLGFTGQAENDLFDSEADTTIESTPEHAIAA